MVASGVGQYSINVKSNLKDFYGTLTNTQKELKTLTEKKLKLEVDSSKLDELRDKGQRIAAQMRELRQQKTEIKLGNTDIKNTELAMRMIDRQISRLNGEKLEVEAEIQPIRTTNIQLNQIQSSIERINRQKIKFNFEESSLGRVKSTIDTISSLSGKVGDKFEKLGGTLSKISAVALAPVVLGTRTAAGYAEDFLKSTVNYSMEVEQSKATLRAQGIESEKLKSTFREINDFANISPFDVGNMTDSVSAVNAYVGNIDKALRATKVFGTSLYASGRDASELQNVAVNLGQLATGNFTKADFKQLTQGVPAISQALRDIDINKWEDFTAALGDDPGTKQIEITGDALGLVTDALDNYNKKTNALEESNKSLKAQFDNAKGQFNTMRDAVLNSSGAYEEIHKVFDAFGDKINSPEIKQALTELFKGSIPYLKKVEDGIRNFNINNFIAGVKDGENAVKEEFDNIRKDLENAFNFFEHFPIVGNIIQALKGDLNGNEGSFGKFLGDFISGSLKIGTTGLKLSLVGKGINFFSTITGMLGTGLGGVGKIKEWIANRLSKEVAEGVSAGVSSGVSGGVSAGGIAAGTGKVSKGLSVLGKGVGVVAKAGFTFEGLGILDQVRGILKNYNLKEVEELYKDLPETYPDLASRLKTLKEFSDKLAEVTMNTGAQNFTNDIVNGVTAVGAGLAASGTPLAGIGAGVATAGFIFKGLQVVDDLRENMKMDRIQKLFSIAKDLKDLDFAELTNLKIGEKIKGLTKALVDVYNGLHLETMVDLGSDSGKYTLGEVIISLDSQLPDSSMVTRVAEVLKRIKSMSDSLKVIGSIEEYKNIGQGIINLKSGLVQLSHALGGGDEDKELSFGPQMGPMPNGVPQPTIYYQSDQFSVIVDQAYEFVKKIAGKIEKLDEITQNIVTLKKSLDGIKNIGSLEGVGAGIANVKEGLNEMLSAFGPDLAGKQSGQQMLGENDDFGSIAKDLSKKSADLDEQLPNIKTEIDNLKLVGDSLKLVQGLNLDEKAVLTQITIIKEAINSLSSVATEERLSDLKGISEAVNTITKDMIQNYPPQYTELGKTLATKMSDSFKEKLNFSNAVELRTKEITRSLAEGKGKSLANALNSEFNSTLNLGQQIKKQLQDAISQNYKTKLSVDLSTNKIGTPSNPSKYPTVVMASGGRVATDSQLQDSPEKPILGNGEYVIPKKIVNALGVPFFDKLRSGQISRTFAGLAQSVSNTTSSVVNNIYNNQTTNQHMNVYPSGHQDMMMISNRRIRV
ncbi:tape measure protein [Lactococcus lactis]|uniref:tape measure protein n=1 Tax=Lactococcus lactis TaxID=1358 RepID=UPI0024167091|nr:tape measure protein [Lactococcus lactis]MDG4968247.1 hypothetical protein [Lactococcus lactis]MDG5102197.1 hypothetical protein [Lactococcus lactis]